MNVVTIHDTGAGGDRLRIDSHGNGVAYTVNFGEAGSPMRTLHFQGDDAVRLRDEFDGLENREPDTETRDVWMRVLDPYT